MGYRRVYAADYGAALDGITDDTAAVQAAINVFSSTGATIVIEGKCLIGALTWPSGVPYRLEVAGEIRCAEGATFTIPSLVDFIGIGGAYTSQFSSDGTAASIRGSETSNPVVRVVGSRGKTIEGLVIQPPKFVGLEITGASALGALLKMRNVSCTARIGVATSQPFVSQTFFWLDAQDCSFMGQSDSHPYPVEFKQDAATGAYGGLVRFRGLRLNAGGIRISTTQPAFSSDFVFEDAQLENAVAGTNLLELDNQSSNFIGSVKLIRPRFFDTVDTGDVFTLHVSPTSKPVRRIEIQGVDYNHPLVRPTTAAIQGLSISGNRHFPYSSPIGKLPSFTDFKREYDSAVDIRLVNAPRVPSVLPVTPLAVQQDPATWAALASGGATVETGILAPDGTLTAGRIAGANGGLVTLYGSSTVVALGDWFIAGVWLQSAEVDKMPANARLDLASGGWKLNNTNSTVLELGRDYEPMAVADRAWKWVCEACKITTAGSGNTYPRLYLRRDTTYGLTNYWMPGLIHIPASLGMSDADVAQLARSLTAWPSTGGAGRLALPSHQHLQLSMAWNKGHLIDEAGNHLWMNAGKLYTKPSAPSSGTDGVLVGSQS